LVLRFGGWVWCLETRVWGLRFGLRGLGLEYEVWGCGLGLAIRVSDFG